MSGRMTVTSVEVVGIMPVRSPESRQHSFDPAGFLRDNAIGAVRDGDAAALGGLAAALGQSVRNLLEGRNPDVDLPLAARFLCDFDVLAARLASAAGDPDAVLADLDGAARCLADVDGAAAAQLRLLARALRRSSAVLRLAPDQLPEQLLTRLRGQDGPLLARLLGKAAAYKSGCWFRPLHVTARHWQQTVRYLRGNATAACFAPSGRLLVVDNQRWLECLDLSGGEPSLLFRTGDGEPTGLAFDGTYAAIATRDGPVEVVDLIRGRRDPLVPVGGGRATLAVAFVRPGCLVSAGTDGRVRLWDVAAGVQTGQFDAGDVSVHALLPIGPDKLLLGTSPDPASRCALQLWDLPHLRQEKLFAEHDWPVTALDLAAGADLVVAAANDALSAWRLPDLTSAWRVVREHVTFHSLVCLPEGLLVGDSSGSLRLFAPDDGAEVRRLPPHGGLVPAMAVDTDRRRLVTVSYDQTVRLWDVAALAEPDPFHHQQQVTALAVTPDGSRLISGSKDGRLLLWDARTASPRAELGRHGHWVSEVVALAGDRAVSVGWDGVLRVWDLHRPGGTATDTGDAHVTHLACTSDGSLAVTASTDGAIRVWDLADARRLDMVTGPPDDRVVAVAVDGSLVRWLTAAGRLFRWPRGSAPIGSDILPEPGRVTACHLGAPGGTPVVGLADGRVVSLGADGTAVTLGAGVGCGPTAIVRTPDEELLVATYGVPHLASDHTARLWRGRDRRQPAVLVGDLPWTAAAIAPDRRHVYLGDGSGAVHVVEPVPPALSRPGPGPDWR
ncbi:hypothetical protein QEZ54_30995 [Catellatospora sp. KI3]|uniref:WD40 repeat domain-containing protein n=1 Tax=Catellatospora sp. KI3 TaxID=3041620 RepID=UPI0024825AE7|nr:hypothetical protein [Catellatospora sp. KI3]MDI1465405.1 hypothetical protein [Catellatospora sp. KI3]